MQSRNGNIPIASDESADDEAPDDARMWYARLRIRDDRLAKLWVWKLAEHDVIVWSESDERWKQLLAVPELRTAVRKATTSAFARKSSPPPALPAPDSATRRRHFQTVSDFEGEELTTRVNRPSSFPDDVDMEPTAVTWARTAHNTQSSAPPPPIELLRALTTSAPPEAHSANTPEFPRAPKVPSISELARSTTIHSPSTSDQGANSSSFLPPPTHSDIREIRPSSGASPHAAYSLPPPSLPPQVITSRPPAPPSALRRTQPSVLAVRPQYVVPRPPSQFTVKNLSWAMLPIACAAVFAFFLDRYLPHKPSTTIAFIESPSESGGQLGSWIGAMLGMSLGRGQPAQQPAAQNQPPQTVPNLTPEQLAPVGGTRQAWAPRNAAASHAAVGRAAPRAAAPSAPRADDKDKASAQASSSGASAAAGQTGFNESFDREGARTALKFAAARVRNCSNSGVTGSALITFGPSGTVQKVQISQMVGDDVDASCVNRALSNTRVPPFTGAPVTVRKSF